MRLLLIGAAMFLPPIAHAHCPEQASYPTPEIAEQMMLVLGKMSLADDQTSEQVAQLAMASTLRERNDAMSELVGAQMQVLNAVQAGTELERHKANHYKSAAETCAVLPQ